MVVQGQSSGLTFFSNLMFSCVYLFIYLFMPQTGYKGVRLVGALINEHYLRGKMYGETIVGGFTVYERKLGTGYRNF